MTRENINISLAKNGRPLKRRAESLTTEFSRIMLSVTLCDPLCLKEPPGNMMLLLQCARQVPVCCRKQDKALYLYIIQSLYKSYTDTRLTSLTEIKLLFSFIDLYDKILPPLHKKSCPRNLHTS